MYFSTLSEWLLWIKSVHSSEIDLGLDRVKAVASRLQVLTPSCPVIAIAGTNGKGSCVAGLEAIYLAAGYHVGAFTSPTLFKHNEQVRINGEIASDQAFCQAFEKIEAARGTSSLTPFEYCTLAALLIFQSHSLDVLLLEVGLGGRLDAVNIIDADVAVVTSIGIDHVDWLGSTREQIAYEKAGIFRAERPAVCGDEDAPASLQAQASQLGSPLFCQAKDFSYDQAALTWTWTSSDITYDNLPLNTLATQNMSTVLMVVTLLQSRLPVSRLAVDEGLSNIKLLGRIQVIEGKVTTIYDVSHNPAAVALLAKRLKEMPCTGKTYGVFSMLADKDITESIKAIRNVIDIWHVAPLSVDRAASKKTLMLAFQAANVDEVSFFSTIEAAFTFTEKVAETGDSIVVFGSFHTVAQGWLSMQKTL